MPYQSVALTVHSPTHAYSSPVFFILRLILSFVSFGVA